MRPPGLPRLLAFCGSFARSAVWLPVWLLVFAGACYEGAGPLEPPPGSPGGACYEPSGTCDQPNWVCEPDGRYCYDPALPCRGVFCGEHGVCQADKAGLPVCYCDTGYSNAAYSLYCEEP